jgi:clan AA aspartic protease (TIGR02281 family)
MTILNARIFKTTLLFASVSLAALTSAHAELTKIGESGAWLAYQGTMKSGRPACQIATDHDGWSVNVTAVSNDPRLAVSIRYPDGQRPDTTITSVGLRFVANVWEKPNNVSPSATSLWMFIDPASARDFVHELTAGTTMRYSFNGVQQPWEVSLSGTTAIWSQFMDCAKSIAPQFVASLTTGTAPPAASFGSTAFAPPAAALGAQPDITEVGLLTQGGVKHVRGLAGSSTAIMFVLDSGAADVQITRKAALNLALAGELTATGRTTTFVTATGAANVQPVYLLRSLTVGERTVTNVECNVTDDGDPLLGQSFLGRLGSWSINNAKQTLVLGAAVSS